MSDTPVTDAFREVVFAQYKEDELTGDGMGNILAALPDIESLERERDEALEECAKWHGMAIEADKRFVESVLLRDEESKKSRRERAIADRLAGAAKAVIDQWQTPNWKLTEPTATYMNKLMNTLAAWKGVRGE